MATLKKTSALTDIGAVLDSDVRSHCSVFKLLISLLLLLYSPLEANIATARYKRQAQAQIRLQR